MKLTDDELVSAIEAEEETAINWADGPLAAERTEAIKRFNSEPIGNEVEGRSQVVSSAIRDAIEGVMPSLCRIFLSGDEIGKFEPIDPNDTGYEAESAVCNWYLMVKNSGFEHLYTCIKEALLNPTSYAKVWWQTDESIVSERYQGLSDEEAAMIMQDRDVEVVEHTEYPDPYAPLQQMMQPEQMGAPQPQPMLHDIKVERVKPDEFVAFCPVPPDELLVSSNHRETRLATADFVQHRRNISLGEIRALGYEVDDDVGDDVDDSQRAEAQSRQRYGEYAFGQEEDNEFDRSRRRVTLRETWMRLDGGDGKQVLWRICIVGRTILHKEEADLIPIAAFSSALYPHSHCGISFYSLINDIAEIETTVTRQYLDSLYLANSPRSIVDVNRVNIDDMLISRPGGIVRVEGEPMTAVTPLISPDVGQSALSALEYLSSIKENRTGVARVNQGALDPNSLNRTATGASLMMSAGQARLELIARCLAGGFRDLFLIVHAIASKHSTKPMQLKIANKWQVIDPRSWVKRTDFALSVALGTGAPEQQMAKLQMIGQFLQQGQQMGLVTRENMYNWASEMLKAAGYRNPDKFVTAPTPENQPQPQQPPEVQAAQIQMQGMAQVEQIKQQGQAQGKALETQARAQADQQKAMQDAALAERKMQQDAELERYKLDLGAENAIRLKLIEVAGNVIAQSLQPQTTVGADGETETEPPDTNAQMGEMIALLTQTMERLAQATSAPRQIVRGPDGRAVGVQSMVQ